MVDHESSSTDPVGSEIEADVEEIETEQATTEGESTQGSDSSLDRREFLAVSTLAIGGVLTASIAIPAAIYVIGPSLSEESTQDWIRLGPVTKVELGEPTLFKVNVTRRTGWIVNEDEISFYVLTENGRDFIALSSICTHLGCRVRWIDDQDQYLCPCHVGIFDKLGEVVSGPPPRPLDRYEVKVEDGQLYVLGG